MRERIGTIFVTWVLLLSVYACTGDNLIEIRVENAVAMVEVAADDDARRRGLMNRKWLAEDRGLLMVFPVERPVQIWMLNVHIPLDVGFFDESGILINRLSMLPDGGREIHRSGAPARYALEMNMGWFERMGLEPGDHLRLPYPIKAE